MSAGGSSAMLDSRGRAQFSCPVGSAAETASIELSDVMAPGGDGELRQLLDRYGYCLVTGVVDAPGLGALEAAWDADIDSLIDHPRLAEAPSAVRAAYEAFQRDGSSVLPLATASTIAHPKAGFVLRRGLAHGQFAWEARSHPNVRRVFERLWGTAELTPSCDVPFFSPHAAPEAQTMDMTAHVDQNRCDVRGLAGQCACYQGVLYVWGSTEARSSTTVVWPGSHRNCWPRLMQDEKIQQIGQAAEHYTEILQAGQPEIVEQLRAGWLKEAIRVACPAGSLLLWNSRTVHQGWCGGARLAQTCCWEPTAHAADPESVRRQKLRMVCLGLPSTHWASLGQQHDMTLDDPADEPVAAAVTEQGGVVLPLRSRARQPYVRVRPLSAGD